MKPPDEITLDELLDEAWAWYFLVARSVLRVIASTLLLLAMLVAIVTYALFAGANWLKDWVENWEPTKPGVFQTEKE